MAKTERGYLDLLPILPHERPSRQPTIRDRLIGRLAANTVTGWLGDKYFAVAYAWAHRSRPAQERLLAATKHLESAIDVRQTALKQGFTLAPGNELFTVDVREYSYHGEDGYNVLLFRRDSSQDAVPPLNAANINDADVVITVAGDQEPLFLREGEPVTFRALGACLLLGYATDAIEATTQNAARTA